MEGQGKDKKAPVASRIFASEEEEHAQWAAATPEERLAETMRLTREKWDDACDKPIEKVAFIRRLGDEE